MQYQVGQPGRVIVARFNDGDDVLGGLETIARQENLRAACFSMVGGIKKGGYVVGPETEEMPPVPVWRELAESHEATGFGTIFWHGDQPKVHFHGAYAKRDNVRGRVSAQRKRGLPGTGGSHKRDSWRGRHPGTRSGIWYGAVATVSMKGKCGSIY